MGSGAPSFKAIDIIWFDEGINTDENQNYIKEFKPLVNTLEAYDNLDKGFDKFYEDKFITIFTIVSGKLWGRFLRMFKENINKIINIPWVVIFTSEKFKNILLQKEPDEKHILSYDTINGVNDSFYNPEGIVASFKELKEKILSFSRGFNCKIKKRTVDKKNFEGVLTFEYLQNEEDLLAPALYKEVITNEKIKKEEKKYLINYFLSFKNNNLENLFMNLKNFKNIPIEILSKYSARAYTYETDFYKTLNYDLMKSKMKNNYKTFIKLLYNGIDIKSFSSFTGKLLYRGSRINKSEIEKIFDYKNKRKLKNIVVFSKAYLSFTEDESKALNFIGNSDEKFIGILFVLENNNYDKQESNADIHEFSPYKDEKEILFFPGSSFIIKDIYYIDNNNKVKIILNYNGKFKEQYNLIYENKRKLNDLIKGNIMTKSIAGKELEFLENGKYLIIEKMSELNVNRFFIKNVMKAKNLENNEIVYIKEIPNIYYSWPDKYQYQLTYLLDKLKIKAKKAVWSLKETFYINDSFYIVVEIYDDYLSNYLKNKAKKGLSANLIKKIMLQLKEVLFSISKIDSFWEKLIIIDNILIKYTNENKNNFDIYLDALYYNPSSRINTHDVFLVENYLTKNVNEKFIIGIFLYELYFNEIPFFMESDFKLYNNIFYEEKSNINKEKDFDPKKYPIIKENEDNKIYDESRKKNIINYLEKNKINSSKNYFVRKKVDEVGYKYYNDFSIDEFEVIINELDLNIKSDIINKFGNFKEVISLKEAFKKDIMNRRDNWIKNLKNEFSNKIESNYDRLLLDLISKSIGNNNEEKITNYKDFFDHPFFNQYNY